jgi:hypothetical protein
MRGIHFSLRWLFGVVAFLAISCGLLIYASPFLSKLTATLAAVALLAAIPAAIYHAGDRRAFWAGFSLFGFAYLWLVCGTWQSHDGSTALRKRLVTTDLLTRCYEVLPGQASTLPVLGKILPTQSGTVVIDPLTSTYTGDLTVMPNSTFSALSVTSVATSGVDRADFLTTGHSLFAILFALLGGAITRRYSSRARGVSSTPSEA